MKFVVFVKVLVSSHFFSLSLLLFYLDCLIEFLIWPLCPIFLFFWALCSLRYLLFLIRLSLSVLLLLSFFKILFFLLKILLFELVGKIILLLLFVLRSTFSCLVSKLIIIRGLVITLVGFWILISSLKIIITKTFKKSSASTSGSPWLRLDLIFKNCWNIVFDFHNWFWLLSIWISTQLGLSSS